LDGINLLEVVIFTFMLLVLSLVSRHVKDCVNVDSMVSKYCSLTGDDKRFDVPQFMRDSILLRDTDRNSGCCTMLSSNELGCILDYLATMYLFAFAFALLYPVYDLVINKYFRMMLFLQ